MNTDTITFVKIEETGELHIKPENVSFTFIYREAMEIHWNSATNTLFSPKPREWSYLKWFAQILDSAKEQGCILQLSTDTLWINISDQLKNEIISYISSFEKVTITELCELNDSTQVQNHSSEITRIFIDSFNDWPTKNIENIFDFCDELKSYFGNPITIEKILSKKSNLNESGNSWKLESGESIILLIEKSNLYFAENDFDNIVKIITNNYRNNLMLKASNDK